MQVITKDLINGRRVLLRYDIDVVLHPLEDFKLKAGLETLKLCLENASKVILMGHLGRPEGKPVESLRVAPIVEWFKSQGFEPEILENLRFDPREESGDLDYARELAQMGDFYINEAFSSYRPAVSTTVLPTLLPHAAGLHFAQEVEILTRVRNNPKKPFVAIMGGAKVTDKLPVIEVLAKKADAVLVGGKLVSEIRMSWWEN
ncbi:MAG: Phosphoglycerate kinase [Candidatus Daviesbacteria bacterium GW2011_GWF2_38_6]|uniref:Phosphoglycerate kinase n=1 Tax=Candidatus Daviesbacteria bacterium GW2011_GWF2_38_6 TaxID=1618432 RepID=A0A0G0KE60_9BACT|nr:MAG: Phosphoglycerate kinase [Candidatus Daviesbacteria bacterium GW2011_GWF2_38_6]